MHTIDIELPDDQAARLDRFARSVSKTPRKATAQLIEEGLRHVEFRDSPVGRQAFVAGSSLAVWEAVMAAESYELNPARSQSSSVASCPARGDRAGSGRKYGCYSRGAAIVAA